MIRGKVIQTMLSKASNFTRKKILPNGNIKTQFATFYINNLD